MVAIIALCGDSNTGKTETLKKLITNIEKNFGCSATDVHNAHHPEKRKSSLRKERVVTLVCKSKESKELKIGITTRGDSVDLLEYDFKDMGSDCVVYICACHPSKSFRDYFQKVKADEITIIGRCFVEDEKTIVDKKRKATPRIDKLRSSQDDKQVIELAEIIKSYIK